MACLIYEKRFHVHSFFLSNQMLRHIADICIFEPRIEIKVNGQHKHTFVYKENSTFLKIILIKIHTILKELIH